MKLRFSRVTCRNRRMVSSLALSDETAYKTEISTPEMLFNHILPHLHHISQHFRHVLQLLHHAFPKTSYPLRNLSHPVVDPFSMGRFGTPAWAGPVLPGESTTPSRVLGFPSEVSGFPSEEWGFPSGKWGFSLKEWIYSAGRWYFSLTANKKTSTFLIYRKESDISRKSKRKKAAIHRHDIFFDL